MSGFLWRMAGALVGVMIGLAMLFWALELTSLAALNASDTGSDPHPPTSTYLLMFAGLVLVNLATFYALTRWSRYLREHPNTKQLPVCAARWRDDSRGRRGDHRGGGALVVAARARSRADVGQARLCRVPSGVREHRDLDPRVARRALVARLQAQAHRGLSVTDRRLRQHRGLHRESLLARLAHSAQAARARTRTARSLRPPAMQHRRHRVRRASGSEHIVDDQDVLARRCRLG